MLVQEDISSKYLNIRKQTEKICAPLAAEDTVVQPIMDVSPPKWHLGHTTWFFENFILARHLEGYRLFNPDFNYLFNSYYESQGDKVARPKRGLLTRPTRDEVMLFRKHVDEHMQQFFEQHEEISDELQYVIQLGLNHEQQHQELLITDIKYILSKNPLFPVYQKENENSPNGSETDLIESWSEIPEDVYYIGYHDEGFHFDNEKGVHKVFLHNYRIMDRLITNGEYMEFMEDGGYEDFRHWLSDGWDWVNEHQMEAPLYWHKRDGEWQQFTMNGLRKVQPNEPVTHISFYEADAFARWKGKRLPTEFEWEVAVRTLQPSVDEKGNFSESGLFRPVSRQGSAFQFYGDVWEWTNSAYLPYPYFKPAPGAVGEYNGKFMVNQMVLRGGSCATPKDHIRPTYRNFFHADKQWQFTGIRLAESL